MAHRARRLRRHRQAGPNRGRRWSGQEADIWTPIGFLGTMSGDHIGKHLDDTLQGCGTFEEKEKEQREIGNTTSTMYSTSCVTSMVAYIDGA